MGYQYYYQLFVNAFNATDLHGTAAIAYVYAQFQHLLTFAPVWVRYAFDAAARVSTWR